VSRSALSAALLALAACATVPPTPDARKIEHLELKGASAVSANDTKKRILTSESSWWPGWMPLLGDVQWFDESAWAADLKRIERYYQTQGFSLARVTDESVTDTSPGHVDLSVTINEGPPTTIASIERLGLDALPPDHRATVLKGLTLAPGARFLEAQWDQEKQAVAARLRELGYAEATVDGDVQIELTTSRAKLTLTATTGPRYRFGKIFVATDADAKVPGKTIAQQVEGAITAGDWYSESALNEAQALVFQMGVFGAVKVNRGAPDHELLTVPVVVDVREAPFHTIRLGGGVGADQVRQEARLVAEYNDRNFFGGLRRFTLRGKAGWAFLPSVIDVARVADGAQHGPVFRVLTELEQPHVFTRSLSAQVSLDLSSGLEPAYGFIGGTLKVGAPWRPTSTITVFPSYNLDVYFLSSDVPLGGAGPEALFGCPRTCVVSYLEQTFEWDRRDDRLEPKTGTYLGLSLQEGGGPLGGVFTYLRVSPEVRGYVSFGEEKRVTLAARLKGGTLLSTTGDSPIIARFFSGGSSMRGFGTRRLAPLLAVAKANATPDPASGVVPAETLPIGGKGLVEASLELRWNAVGDLVLALFGDAGAVTYETLGPGNLNQLWPYLYTAVGVGARYRTPLGPIRLDLAFRLPFGSPQRVFQTDSRTLGYDVSHGCFGLGGGTNDTYAGSPDGLCAFQLSIGEAF